MAAKNVVVRASKNNHSRDALLTWLNDLLSANYIHVEQLKTGKFYV